MGQLPDKCNCFNKDDKTTFTLDNENKNQSNDNNLYQTKSITVKSNFDANAFLTKNKNNNTFKDSFINYNEEYSNSKKNNPKVENPVDNITELKDPNIIRKLIKFQSVVRSKISRMYYLAIKPKLIEEVIDKINNYASEFTSEELKKAETFMLSEYNKDGWKKYYPDGNDIFELDYGFIVETRLLINKNHTEIYSGYVNINNQKHGYGVKLDYMGNKYEGFWYNDQFSGWGKLIDKEGTVYLGKLVN